MAKVTEVTERKTDLNEGGKVGENKFEGQAQDEREKGEFCRAKHKEPVSELKKKSFLSSQIHKKPIKIILNKK